MMRCFSCCRLAGVCLLPRPPAQERPGRAPSCSPPPPRWMPRIAKATARGTRAATRSRFWPMSASIPGSWNTAPPPRPPSVHKAQAELIYVAGGGCTLIMGGTLTEPKDNGANLARHRHRGRHAAQGGQGRLHPGAAGHAALVHRPARRVHQHCAAHADGAVVRHGSTDWKRFGDRHWSRKRRHVLNCRGKVRAVSAASQASHSLSAAASHGGTLIEFRKDNGIQTWKS